MTTTRRSLAHLIVMVALVVAGFGLWILHATAWDLAAKSPVLSYDSAQYALAGRELAEQHRLATTFALPIELAKHPAPPWPLSTVQPGLVVWEGLIFKLVPQVIRLGKWELLHLYEPHQREWLTLLLPFGCFLTIAALLALASARLIQRQAPALSLSLRAVAGFVVGMAFLLDPEAQHFAVGGMNELPFTLGIVTAFAGIATGRATRHPLLFGLLLGVTGTFRANMLWLAPLFALAAALAWSPAERPGAAGAARTRIFALALIGFVVPLAPWWLYKWRAFGSPGWDLTRYVLWDGIEGRTWFSLYHLPEHPELPSLATAWPWFTRKLLRNLGPLTLASTVGPRALWIGALVAWLLVRRPARAPGMAAAVILVASVIGVLTAALAIPWLRYVFPTRVPLEAAGLLATWAMVARVPNEIMGPAGRRVLQIAVVVLALGWGAWQTTQGNQEAARAADTRGLPSVLTLRDLGHRLRRELAPGEPVMSNLGPTLSWYSRRPVVHLALTPLDVEACRLRLEFRHVVLAFRSPERAWQGWNELLENPELAVKRPEWNIARARRFRELDGFVVVWLELGPPGVRMAAR
ncbi:MAG TPA: hypothetical protein VEY91_02535 [Candidatus Limnocylindria bacterium]|nr:hypothetical protein [Candidatus Limnocylindria bacterium]